MVLVDGKSLIISKYLVVDNVFYGGYRKLQIKRSMIAPENREYDIRKCDGIAGLL